MARITLDLPETAPLAVLQDMADKIGCVLRYAGPGHFIARPRAGNGNVVKFPRYHGQVRGARLPSAPEAG